MHRLRWVRQGALVAYRFFRGAIDQRRSLYLASPLKGTLIQPSGRFAELYTAYAGELQMLREAGYTCVGDSMVPR